MPDFIARFEFQTVTPVVPKRARDAATGRNVRCGQGSAEGKATQRVEGDGVYLQRVGDAGSKAEVAHHRRQRQILVTAHQHVLKNNTTYSQWGGL